MSILLFFCSFYCNLMSLCNVKADLNKTYVFILSMKRHYSNEMINQHVTIDVQPPSQHAHTDTHQSIHTFVIYWLVQYVIFSMKNAQNFFKAFKLQIKIRH